MVREIHLARVFFTDFSTAKIRPVLIFKEEKEDVFFLPLTTNLSQAGVRISSTDLEEGRLQKDSIVVVHKIGLLHRDLLIRRIGKVKASVFQRIKKAVCSNLSCL